jgi:arylsulfatase A-like enzyme
MQPTARFTRIFAASTAALLAVWLGAARWVVPRVIESAYRGESLDVLNAIIQGRNEHGVERYLDAWSAMARVGAVSLVLGAALVYVLVRFHAPIWARIRSGLWGEPGLGLMEALAVGAGAGLLLGFAEAVPRMIRWSITADPRDAPPLEILWTAPIAGAIALFAVGAVVWLALAWGGRPSARAFVFLLGILVFYTALRAPAIGLHDWACWILGAGIASQVAAALAKSQRGPALAYRGTAYLAIGTVLLAGSLWAVERLGRNVGTSPAEAGSPNVLLLVLDTVRSKSLGLYGYDRATTPNLERWAGSSVVFDRAMATAPWTLPSHATLFTGLWDHELTADFDAPLDPSVPTLAEVLSARGYETGGFVANVLYCSEASGLDRGFGHYVDHTLSLAFVAESAWITRLAYTRARRALGIRGLPARSTAADINRQFLDWHDGLDDAPFFAFLNYFDAHHPYEVRPPFDRMFRDPPPRYWRMGWGRHTPEELDEYEDAYDSAIAYLDEQIDRLLTELDERGVLDNTIVVVTSDHGEQFGEHGLSIHANSLYTQLLHVPLMVRFGDRLPGGSRIASYVSLRDVPATVLDLAGAESGALPGTSLATLWRPTAPPADRTLFSQLSFNRFAVDTDPVRRGPLMRSVMQDRMHLIVNGDGVEELYDLTADFEEIRDLSADSSQAQTLDRLRLRLESDGADPRTGETVGGTEDRP